jgi:23S rRNA (cytidine2498-2'-O)-methyltransferase
MTRDSAQFVFMTCRAGAESAVKEEVARLEPTWRPSFSRPGFLTFKCPGNRPLDERELAERNWTFAHAHGISLGRLTGERLAPLVAQVWQHEVVVQLTKHGGFADVHVWQREPATSDDDGESTFVTPLCEEIESALRAAAPDACAQLRQQSAASRRLAPRGGRVLDVVVVEPGQWWIGYHRAVRRAERSPGGMLPVHFPDHAVSRAYAKLDEALQWSGLPIAAGDECVEIGCAPGGVSQALLDRGLFVTGIDPADVDPTVLEHPRFRHLKKRGRDVRHQEFAGVRWLAADMNIAPEATLDEVERIVRHPAATIRGMILTLKFSDWSRTTQLPELAARVRSWGYRDVRARQLVTGGQEVCLVALRRKALRRLSGKSRRKKKIDAAPVAETARRSDAAHEKLPGPHF